MFLRGRVDRRFSILSAKLDTRVFESLMPVIINVIDIPYREKHNKSTVGKFYRLVGFENMFLFFSPITWCPTDGALRPFRVRHLYVEKSVLLFY